MASEDLRYAAGFEVVGDVGSAGAFAAEAWGGKELVWVGDVLRVEGVADALHGFEVGVGIHVGHAALLFATDAVLAGDGAAGFHADVEDTHGEVDGAFFFAGVVLGVEADGVKVAVAGVKDIGHAKVLDGSHLGDSFKDRRK